MILMLNVSIEILGLKFYVRVRKSVTLLLVIKPEQAIIQSLM